MYLRNHIAVWSHIRSQLWNRTIAICPGFRGLSSSLILIQVRILGYAECREENLQVGGILYGFRSQAEETVLWGLTKYLPKKPTRELERNSKASSLPFCRQNSFAISLKCLNRFSAFVEQYGVSRGCSATRGQALFVMQCCQIALNNHAFSLSRNKSLAFIQNPCLQIEPWIRTEKNQTISLAYTRQLDSPICPLFVPTRNLACHQ